MDPVFLHYASSSQASLMPDQLQGVPLSVSKYRKVEWQAALAEILGAEAGMWPVLRSSRLGPRQQALELTWAGSKGTRTATTATTTTTTYANPPFELTA
jgi:hypothetical protein